MLGKCSTIEIHPVLFFFLTQCVFFVTLTHSSSLPIYQNLWYSIQSDGTFCLRWLLSNRRKQFINTINSPCWLRPPASFCGNLLLKLTSTSRNVEIRTVQALGSLSQHSNKQLTSSEQALFLREPSSLPFDITQSQIFPPDPPPNCSPTASGYLGIRESQSC